MTLPSVSPELLQAARAAMTRAFGGAFVVEEGLHTRAVVRPPSEAGELDPRFVFALEQPIAIDVQLAMPFSPAEPTWLQQLVASEERVRYTRTVSFDTGPEFALSGRWLDLAPLRAVLEQVPAGRAALLSAEWTGWQLSCRFRHLPQVPPFEVVRGAVAARAGLLRALPQKLRERFLGDAQDRLPEAVGDTDADDLRTVTEPYSGIVERTVSGIEARVHLGGHVDENWTGELTLAESGVALRLLLPSTPGRLALRPQTGFRGMWLSLWEDELDHPDLDKAFVVEAQGDEKPAWARRRAPVLMALAAEGATVTWDADALHIEARGPDAAGRLAAARAGLELWRSLAAGLSGFLDPA